MSNRVKQLKTLQSRVDCLLIYSLALPTGAVNANLWIRTWHMSYWQFTQYKVRDCSHTELLHLKFVQRPMKQFPAELSPVPSRQLSVSRGARRQAKGIAGGGDQSHRSLRPSANRHAPMAGATHPPQTRRPQPHCPPPRREVPRAVAAPSPALLVPKSTAVDSVTTWVLRLRRDGHIGFLDLF